MFLYDSKLNIFELWAKWSHDFSQISDILLTKQPID